MQNTHINQDNGGKPKALAGHSCLVAASGGVTLRTKGGDQLTAANKPYRVTNHDAAYGRRRVICRDALSIPYAASLGVSHLCNAYRHRLLAPLSFVFEALTAMFLEGPWKILRERPKYRQFLRTNRLWNTTTTGECS